MYLIFQGIQPTTNIVFSRSCWGFELNELIQDSLTAWGLILLMFWVLTSSLNFKHSSFHLISHVEFGLQLAAAMFWLLKLENLGQRLFLSLKKIDSKYFYIENHTLTTLKSSSLRLFTWTNKTRVKFHKQLKKIGLK